MVHSSMSPHLFEQSPQIRLLTPPASSTFSIPCALPFLEYSQPTDSQTLPHSCKNTRGYTPSIPFRNSPLHESPRELPPRNHNETDLDMECGAPAPLLINRPTPPISRRAPVRTDVVHSIVTASTPDSRPIHNSREIISRRLDSSLTTSHLLRIYQC
jgi:hypothetical protein